MEHSPGLPHNIKSFIPSLCPHSTKPWLQVRVYVYRSRMATGACVYRSRMATGTRVNRSRIARGARVYRSRMARGARVYVLVWLEVRVCTFLVAAWPEQHVHVEAGGRWGSSHQHHNSGALYRQGGRTRQFRVHSNPLPGQTV